MNVHEYLFERRDLRDWHHDFDGARSGDRKKHGGEFTDSPAFTHCICYGAAAHAVEPLLAEIERLRDEIHSLTCCGEPESACVYQNA